MIYVVYGTDFWEQDAAQPRYFLRLVTSDWAQACQVAAALMDETHIPYPGQATYGRDVRDVPPLRRIMTYAEIEALPR